MGIWRPWIGLEGMTKQIIIFMALAREDAALLLSGTGKVLR